LGKTPETTTVETPQAELAKSFEVGTDTPSTSEDVPVVWCCGIEMSWAKTTLNVDDWKGAPSKLGKVLPVIVYMCPRCGKIEFKVDNRN
jgi:hypothetical protein